MGPRSRIGCEPIGLALDHAPHPWPVRPLMQLPEPFAHGSIGLRDALVVPHVVQPSRVMVALQPDLRVLQILETQDLGLKRIEIVFGE